MIRYKWKLQTNALQWSPVEYQEIFGFIGCKKDITTCCLSIKLLVITGHNLKVLLILEMISVGALFKRKKRKLYISSMRLSSHRLEFLYKYSFRNLECLNNPLLNHLKFVKSKGCFLRIGKQIQI